MNCAKTKCVLVHARPVMSLIPPCICSMAKELRFLFYVHHRIVGAYTAAMADQTVEMRRLISVFPDWIFAITRFLIIRISMNYEL